MDLRAAIIGIFVSRGISVRYTANDMFLKIRT